MYITINKQRIKKENLCNAPLHPLPLSQVSVLLQNLQQLPQVPNLTRIVMMMIEDDAQNIPSHDWPPRPEEGET